MGLVAWDPPCTRVSRGAFVPWRVSQRSPKSLAGLPAPNVFHLFIIYTRKMPVRGTGEINYHTHMTHISVVTSSHHHLDGDHVVNLFMMDVINFKAICFVITY